MISIVIPLFNEIDHGYIQKYIPYYLSLKDKFNIELILIDGASTDETKEYIESYNLKLNILRDSTRLKRIQRGVQLAKGEVIILHHPRSILEISAFEQLLKTKAYWGGFTHKFDHAHPLLKFTSFYSNIVRADLKSIFYLDHCIFLRVKLKEEILKIKDREIFEDTEISKKLKNINKPKRLKAISKTSAIRFNKNGVLRQCLLNQKLKMQYWLNKDHRKMNKNYEKELNLNNDTQ